MPAKTAEEIESLIKSCEQYACAIAREFFSQHSCLRRWLDEDDVKAVARAGLWKAAAKYDPSCVCTYTALAVAYARNEVAKLLQQTRDKTTRQEFMSDRAKKRASIANRLIAECLSLSGVAGLTSRQVAGCTGLSHSTEKHKTAWGRRCLRRRLTETAASDTA